MSIPAPHSSFDTSSEAQRERAKRGRRTGSRAKLAQRFFEDTYAAWEEQGPSVLARAAFHDPVAFANMVARLMPQKIEHSVPTDGMSDERLAEMLELAERMARLRAGEGATVIEGVVSVAPLLPAAAPVYENGAAVVSAREGGGGPDRVEPHGGVNTSSPLRARPTETADNPVAQHNKLDRSTSAPLIAETRDADGTPVLPYPVGKPFATPDHDVSKRNRANLWRDDDIDGHGGNGVDPASLF